MLASAGTAQVPQDTAQPPAPIVRVPLRPQPRPQVQPQAGAASGATKAGGAKAGAANATAKPQTVPSSSPAGPVAVPIRRPRPAVTTSPGEASGTAPRVVVKANTAPAPGGATSVAPEHKAPPLSATGVNRNVIVVDPAHGGADSGGRIGDATLEKNVTLALAFRLRSLLVARGFTVVLTRDSDVPAPTTTATTPAASLSLDDRAGIADHARAAACLLLHATGRGTGVHLYRSDLQAAPDEVALLPWLTAQAAWVPASERLEQGIAAALGRSHIALVSSTASVRPVDSLTCPALVLELAPETDVPASVNDAGYQERVAAAIAGALVVWQSTVQTPIRLPAPALPHAIIHHAAPASLPVEVQP